MPSKWYGEPGKTIQGERRQQVIDLIREGLPRNQIADRVGLGRATISGIAKAEGLEFAHRSQTRVATEARQLDNKARRIKLAAELLDDVEKLRGQLFARTTLHAFGGKDNTHNSVDLDEPIYADKLKIVQAVGTAIDRHLKLDAHDSDEHGLAAVDEWLKGMLGN